MSERIRSGALWVAVVALSVVATSAFGATGYSYSPRKNLLTIWEPCLWDPDFTTIPGNRIREAITGSNKQGYSPTVLRYQDTQKDDSYGQCTRENWDGFPARSGVAYIESHGNKGFIVAVAVGTTWHNRSLADAWRFHPGSDHRAIRVGWWDDEDVYTCDPRNHWFRRNWYATFNANRSIVVVDSCKSAAGLKSVLKSCGGRIGFGYPGGVTDSQSIHNNELLFGRMNGTLDDAEKRVAGDAYAAGDFQANFLKWGNDATTLCPSVRNPSTNNYKPLVWPVGDGAGRSGTGHVIFDTYCDATVPAKEVLT